ncbi:MAG: hypothetical protein NW220_16905 [Leptolyngbyaceae cyanobacterium bins.349]|nr:hypothetical protein [Leptolyngbyaceae cyanobacterium bins.349]
MSSTSIVHPSYYLIVRREGNTWFFKAGGKVFYNPLNIPVSLDLTNRLERYGVTAAKVAIALFRLQLGKPSYYLVNLRDKYYYFCGQEWSDVRSTLQELGIGRPDPLEES